MSSRQLQFAIACLALAVSVEGPAQAGTLEIVHFRSGVPPVVAASNENQVIKAPNAREFRPGFPIWGHLGKPTGSGPFPALVLMHGCGGIRQSHLNWSSTLNAAGYVTLVVDSFRPRSILRICGKRIRAVSHTNRAFDAFGALAYLKRLSYVDAKRIGIVGWSHGGISALGMVQRDGVENRFKDRFKAAIAFYPYCIIDRQFLAPVLILIGEADDWTPVGLCRKLWSRNRAADPPVELVTYPSVRHAFDDPSLKDGYHVEGAFGKKHFLKYDRFAHRDAVGRVISFLAGQLSR